MDCETPQKDTATNPELCEDNTEIMDMIDNESLGSNSFNQSENSDIWKGTDSEDEPTFASNLNNELVTESDSADKIVTENATILQLLNTTPLREEITINNDHPTEHGKDTEETQILTSTETANEEETEILTGTEEEASGKETEKVTSTEEASEKETEILTGTEEASEKETEILTSTEEENLQETEILPSAEEENKKETEILTSAEKANKEDDLSEAIDPLHISDDEQSKENVTDKEENKIEEQNNCRNSEMLNCSEEINDDLEDEAEEDFDPSLLFPEVSMAIDEYEILNNATNENEIEQINTPYTDDVTNVEIAFNLTMEEVSHKKCLYDKNNIETTRIHCTACNKHLGSALNNQKNRFVHPLLKVLVCEKCYKFYKSGEFEKDEDGYELYCRWCGQGGNVLCCSKCEFVFCQKCIRQNFGRKKLKELNQIDEWMCFCCQPQQLSNLRIACVELFEYVRREMSRPDILLDKEFCNTDYSKCCKAIKKPQTKMVESQITEKRPTGLKKKRFVDPDYNPVLGTDNEPRRGPLNVVLNPVASTSVPFRTVIPTAQITAITTTNQLITVPKFIRISGPTNLMNSGAVTRLITPTVTAKPPTALPALIRTNQPAPDNWFDKTVHAAANVNSRLSLSLTKLSNSFIRATNIEDLATVHNKLQETLSMSINSLIQVRKKLRTEFITGIRNTRFPPKLVPISPQPPPKKKTDDDVILIGTPNNSTNNFKARLKIRSMAQLQNVPSECIVIPDDSPSKTDEAICNGDGPDESAIVVVGINGEAEKLEAEPQKVAEETKEDEPQIGIVEKDKEINNVIEVETKEDEPQKEIVDMVEPEIKENELQETNGKSEAKEIDEPNMECKTNNGKVDMEINKDNGIMNEKINTRKRKLEKDSMYNINDDPSPEIKRMLSVKVMLQRKIF